MQDNFNEDKFNEIKEILNKISTYSNNLNYEIKISMSKHEYQDRYESVQKVITEEIQPQMDKWNNKSNNEGVEEPKKKRRFKRKKHEEEKKVEVEEIDV